MAATDKMYDHPASKKARGERMAEKGDVTEHDQYPGEKYESQGKVKDVDMEEIRAMERETKERERRRKAGDKDRSPPERTTIPRAEEIGKQYEKREFWKRKVPSKESPTS